MDVRFEILRQGQNAAPQVQSYSLQADPEQTVLDCLNRIKWEQDGSLAFRKNCRNTICGSCGMRIDGRSGLACQEKLASVLARQQSSQQADRTLERENRLPTIAIAPLGNLPVIRDLVVDMQPFWDDLEAVDPYVSTGSRSVPEREFLQTPEQRSRLDATGNCIMCGACYSECNAKLVAPNFVGPHALAKARRMTADSRDARVEERLEECNEGTGGVWGCTRCYMCNEVCPMGVAPMDRIGEIKQEILARKDASASRSIRHRKVLVELVGRGGWIDERKFGLAVVGNGFRDVAGLASLVPLGLRMLASGKFPLLFEPSQGASEVRALIETVRTQSDLPSATPDDK
ncbi:succinate dehydrogenase and fumarate reductase iron-sulfur protein [Rubidibacter lacunae KORDI 51-2]|uniref:Fumarate reductase iron-sulfur subunit n=1 Tax=Rubidibacter lacunae KORDI 51-2 TaxID=582515 RepID=U5DAA4_9CHRO|nr:succinate dehydrogenase/fumarate reductase iron-sulfur subunit [Rubidibacter lacunae]ERN41508.1 succinate dehydrogenase and fumarate reductase iron-sulfur protein [Rubidibacter lacunae KORDI 51-2]